MWSNHVCFISLQIDFTYLNKNLRWLVPCHLLMLSVEFISTSSTDEDFENYPCTSSSTTSANNNNHQSISNADPPAPLKYSTNPDGLKFVPQAPIQFYYSLQVFYLLSFSPFIITLSCLVEKLIENRHRHLVE